MKGVAHRGISYPATTKEDTHQSTYSPNLPVRFLIYLAQEYQMVIERAERSLYGSGRMLNINRGHNGRLMKQCRVLEEYSKLVAVTRDFMRTTKDLQTALNKAIDYCIENGILKEFLLRNRAEVLGMLLEEFDAEKYERTIRAESMDRINRLIQLLLTENRQDDLMRSTTDAVYRETLFQEFGI